MRGPVQAAFGDEPLHIVVEPAARKGTHDVRLVADELARLSEATAAELNLSVPRPTAAFSRRDRLRPGYAAAHDAVAAQGFTPILRPVGGHLALYGEGSVVLHLWAPHPGPREHIRQRFALMGDCLAGALRSLGVDAGVGPVPGEYCDGEFSVNHAGRTKLVGTGQRIVRAGYLFSAVVMVHSAEHLRAPLTEAYGLLDLPFDPSTVGCVADLVDGVSVVEVVDSLVEAVTSLIARPVVPTRASQRSPSSAG